MMQALALRICATMALTNATFAEERVFDSAIDPVDASLSADAKPVILISTETDEATIEGRDLRGSETKITLLIEIALMGKATIATDDGPTPQVFVPSSDSRIELALDVVRRQIVRTLMIGGGEWGELFRRLVFEFHTVKSRRGAGDEAGARFASRLVMIEVETLAEPEFGGLHGEVWDAFLAKIAEDDATKELAGQIGTALVGEAVPEWRRAANDLGISIEVAREIGLAAIAGDEAPAVLSEGTLEGVSTIEAPDVSP